MSEWQAMIAGFAFYLILEGLLPFFNPRGLKRFMAMSQDLTERQLRVFGAIMLIAGMLLLFSVK